MGSESVARFCARAFDLPVVIARLNTFMGTPNSFPGLHIQAVIGGHAMVAPHDPTPHSPIHIDDMKDHARTAPRGGQRRRRSSPTGAATRSSPCRTGCATRPRLSGKEGKLVIGPAVPGAPAGSVSDPTRRRSITGPCRTDFAQAFRELYDTITAAG